MQVEFETLTNEWTALSDIITVSGSTTYLIQNRGADTLVLLEADSEPQATDSEGVLVLPYQTAQYKKGTQDLYLKAFNRGCSINISAEE